MYGLGRFYTTAELNGYDGYHMASQSKIFMVQLFTEKVLLAPGLKQKVVRDGDNMQSVPKAHN